MGKLSKHGQLNTLAPAVLLLVFAAVVLVFGLIILQEIRDSNTLRESVTNAVIDETLTTVDEKGERVAEAGSGCFFNGFSVTSVRNTTDDVILSSGNYTTTADGFVNYTGGNNGAGNNSNWVVNYSYTHGDVSCVTGNSTIIGLATFGDFWEIIVLAVIITIVIGLLLVVFAGRRAR